MNRLVKVVLMLGFLSLLPSALFAQSNATKKSDANVTKTVKSQKKGSNLEAAYELLKAMNTKKVYENAVNAYTQRLVYANSKLKKVEDKIKAFYNKYIGWSSIKNDLAKLYAKFYTADELKDIANFYKTKTGKKVLKTMAQLNYEQLMLTQNKIKPHLKELQKIIDGALHTPDKKKNEHKNDKKSSK